ncbi:MAG: Hsp20/alpha crystallin family protein [Lentisphaeraceae bacterium]|nr:Hsp20/alpha crystallin family protein [Lentisphaeraceae bacterium]
MNNLARLNSFDNIFDLFFERPSLVNKSNALIPSMNAHETEKEISLEFELAGFNKSDIEVSVENDQLIVSASKKEEKEESDKKWLKKEISRGHYQRRITLPENVNVEKIAAESKDGILYVSIPKVEIVDKVKKISVKG